MLDLSSKIDEVTFDLFLLIDQVTKDLGCEYLVVGATARDLIMYHCYGAPVQRATRDLDFGIQIADWDQFEVFVEKLCELGFTRSRVRQRVVSAEGIPVDLVPFGAVADDDSNIRWPPSGETKMDVTGFDDAARCAHQVIIQNNPSIRIPVASTPGLALLKLIAWDVRSADQRKKDALDLAYLIDNYERVEQVADRLYDIDGLMTLYDWNTDLASSHILGLDTAAIAGVAAKTRVNTILENNLQEQAPNHLIEEMCTRLEDEYEKRLNLMRAFADGFKTEQ